MKVVTAFDLGALIAQAEFIKLAQPPMPQRPDPLAPTPTAPLYNARRQMTVAQQNNMNTQLDAANLNWLNNSELGRNSGIKNMYYRATPGAAMGRNNMPMGYTIYGTVGGDQVEVGRLNAKPGSMYAPSTNPSDIIGALRDEKNIYRERFMPPKTNRVSQATPQPAGPTPAPVKTAEDPLVRRTADHYRDINRQRMADAAKPKVPPLNIPGAAAGAFSGLGSALRTGISAAAAPPQLPSWASTGYQPGSPVAQAPQRARTATFSEVPSMFAPPRPQQAPGTAASGREGLNAYHQGRMYDPLNPEQYAAAPADPQRAAANAYHAGGRPSAPPSAATAYHQQLQAQRQAALARMGDLGGYTR